MKYICFGYLDVSAWEKKTPTEQTALMDECFAYDEVLKKNGNWVSGEGLQGPNTAATLRFGNGKVSVTDGPYAETKDIVGGFSNVEGEEQILASEGRAANIQTDRTTGAGFAGSTGDKLVTAKL